MYYYTAYIYFTQFCRQY